MGSVELGQRPSGQPPPFVVSLSNHDGSPIQGFYLRGVVFSAKGRVTFGIAQK
jgi:hypothetical protein